jgi:hypothetical protein
LFRPGFKPVIFRIHISALLLELLARFIYLSYACDSAVCMESLLSAASRHFYVSNPLCPWQSFRSRSHLLLRKGFRSTTSMTGPTSFVRGEGVCACRPLCLDCFLHPSPVSSVLWVEWSIGWTAARAGVYLPRTNNLLQLSGQRRDRAMQTARNSFSISEVRDLLPALNRYSADREISHNQEVVYLWDPASIFCRLLVITCAGRRSVDRPVCGPVG